MRSVRSFLAFLFLLALLSPASRAEAQARLGVTGGVSIANLSTDEFDETESVTGLDLGAVLVYPFGEMFGFQGEVRYIQKGSSVSFTEEAVTVSGDFELAYLEVPLMLRVTVPTQGAFSPHFLLGGAVSFELSCDVDFLAGEGDLALTFSGPCDEGEIDAQTKSVDFGFVAGGGFDYALNDRLALVAEVVYNLGLADINDDDSGESDSVKNQAIGLRAGFSWAVGGGM